MININPWEAELDAIRVKLYEETKDLSVEEQVRRSNERGRELAAKYGFTIATPSERHAKVVDHEK
jgi:hypothetical protein